MAYHYRPVNRFQPFLLPPDMREWLPAGHLVWFVLEVIERIDTSALHARHRNDGAGRPAYDPDMLLALLVYAYCHGLRSSRRIEAACEVDVAFRIICANHGPDHATIARFRQHHQEAAQALFVEVLSLCAAAGLAQVGVVAVDGTKMGANASLRANKTRAEIEAEVAALFSDAESTDQEEDDRYGASRGDELPPDLADPAARKTRLDDALAVIAAEEAKRSGEAKPARARAAAAEARAARRAERVAEAAAKEGPGPSYGRIFPEREVPRALATLARIKAEVAERRAAVEEAAAAKGRKPGGPAPTKNRDVARAEARLAAALARSAANEARLAKRAAAQAEALERARQKAEEAEAFGTHRGGRKTAARANTTDPDSRVMRTALSWVQGYNAQAAVNPAGIVLAAELSADHNDKAQLRPMVAATTANLAAAGVGEAVGLMLFDAGYHSEDNLSAPGPDRLIASTRTWKLRRSARQEGYLSGDAPPGSSPKEAMEHRLRTEEGALLYARRQAIVEPYFAQQKANRGYRSFLRRGRPAAEAEWRLMATAHNLVKLYGARTAVRPTWGG